jgi:hypothetical protein
METKNTGSSTSSNAQAKPAGLGEILLKKQCEHARCPHHKCERKDLRIGGIDI